MFVMYKIFTSGNVITSGVVFPKVPKERPEMLRLSCYHHIYIDERTEASAPSSK
jgi:hypothetical protein